MATSDFVLYNKDDTLANTTPSMADYDFDTGELKSLSGGGYYAPPMKDGKYVLGTDWNNGVVPFTGGVAKPYTATWEDGVGWTADPGVWKTERAANDAAAKAAYEKHNQEGIHALNLELTGPAIVGALGAGALAGAAGGAAAGGAGAAAGGGAGGAAAAEGAAALSAADIAGLTQMGIDAGLTGTGLTDFVAAGGAANIGIPAATAAAGAAGYETGLEGLNEYGHGPTEATEVAEHTTTGLPTPNPASTIGEKLLKKLTDNPLTAASVAATLAAQSKQNKSGNTQAAKLNEIAAPVSGVANDLLAQYKSGEINAGDAFDINKWEQQQINKTKNYFAKAGMGTSSSANNAVAQIQAQATAMREKARQGLLSSGLQASQISYGPLTNAIQAQAHQDQAFSQSISQALNALMLISAMENRVPVGAK